MHDTEGLGGPRVLLLGTLLSSRLIKYKLGVIYCSAVFAGLIRHLPVPEEAEAVMDPLGDNCP